MSWDAASRGPILNARQKWRQQEHDRRVRLLGEWLATDWEEVVDNFSDANGMVHEEKVLQLMEDVWKMAGGSNAADQRTSGAPEGRGELEAAVRPLPQSPDPGAAGNTV